MSSDVQPRRRRRKKKNEPLFEEPAVEQKPASCAVANCKLHAVEGSPHCVLHAMLHSGKQAATQKQRQATKQGDAVAAALWGLIGMAADVGNSLGTEYINKAAEDPTAAARSAAQAAQQAWQRVRPAPPPVAPTPDPFVILGLDPKKATAADVRTMQKRLAGIYHSDRAGEAVDTSKLKEINAAATECLRRLQQTS